MPSGRTTLTEVATALGCLDSPSLDWGALSRPAIQGVRPSDWNQLDLELSSPRSRAIAEIAFDNGLHFFRHPDGLRGRPPQVIEWTGGRKPPGDQAIPADLCIDHVYLVSCKYLSKITLNTAPARLFEVLLRPTHTRESTDWYEFIAPAEHRSLAEVAAAELGLHGLRFDGGFSPGARAALKRGFGRHARLTGAVAEAYDDLCVAVSTRSAECWRLALSNGGRRAKENLLWRMLRLTSATYFVLGVSSRGDSLQLRVMTPWDWRQSFDLRSFDIEPAVAGQPQVSWTAVVRDLAADGERIVEGHVEIRWSHGRFGGPPEAKVYLDTPHDDVPGYVPLR